uniref:Transcription initiation factor IIA subunit 2 n=1 Tax=Angiostrongylus cantonensis TaxID=6313 RepID=A0A0K0DIT1_ANGCA
MSTAALIQLDEQVVETSVECVQFAPFNSWLAVGRNNGTLCIYETNSSTPRSTYTSPSSQAIIRALWSMESNIPFLCVGSVDGFIRVFDARDGSLHKELGNGPDEVLDMVLLGSNPLRLMTAGSGGTIRMTYYQMYRNTTLGEALQKTLDDLVHEQMIPPQLAVKVLAIYDKAINKALAQKAKNKMYFKAEKLRAYRHCDNVWTFLMERVDFRDSIRVARVKFVACDGSAKMAYVMYRETTLGTALSRTLDEFVEEGLITRPLAMKVLTTFDKNINKALAFRVKNKVQFKADKLVTYRYCDNVWTFVIDGIEFRDIHRSIDRTVDRVKIVACDGRAPGLAGTTTGTL